MDMLHPTITHATPRSYSSDGVDSEMEDEEVDQLDSDSEEEVQVPLAGSASSSSKTRSRAHVERVPGKSTIPLSRIETLLEADGEESHMSKEALFLLSVATEEFIKRLSQAGHRTAHVAKRSIVNYRDVASATHQHNEFKFLEDTIPQPISLSEALQRKAAKEKDMLEEPPAASTIPTPAPSVASIAPQQQPSSRSKGKGRQTQQSNGNTNGEVESISGNDTKRSRERRSRQRHSEEEAAVLAKESVHTHSHGTRRRSSRASRRDVEVIDVMPTAQPHANGHSPLTNGRALPHGSARSRPPNEPASWGAMGPPAIPDSHSPEYDEERFAAEYRSEELWTPAAHFTGPASGYLEDHRMLFSGRNGMTANPGRTIYNPHRQPSRR